MKKVLRFILILLLILVVGFLVLCLVSPSELKIERSTSINAPKARVWKQVVNFKNWENWNAWKEMDSTIVVDIKGTDGQQGSEYHYVGKKAGEGITRNIGVTDGEMKYEMDFIKPFSGKADGYYKVVEEGGKTKVIWYFHENLGFAMRGFMSLMGGTGMMEKMFDRGLELLKVYTETHADDTAVVKNIQDVMFPAHIYAGVRKVVKWTEIGSFCGETYGMLGGVLGDRINGPASAVYYSWDEANMQTDMYPCFSVATNAPARGATITEVAASQAYMMKYVGGYSGSKAAHDALGAHLTTNGKTMGLVIEEYIKGPGETPDSNQYETNIYYLYH